jgi:hypothetical protein
MSPGPGSGPDLNLGPVHPIEEATRLSMHPPDRYNLALPHDAITNPACDHDARLERARAFLDSRGIHEPRPLYGARAMRVTLNARLGAPLARAMDVRCATNDDSTHSPSRRDPSAA